MDGWLRIDGRERERRRRPEQWRPRRGIMAGGKEVTGVSKTRSSGLGSCIQEHRGREGVKGHPPRPRLRPEVMAEAVVAMAGSVELTGAHETGSKGHETRK